jgi:hypothetical protein
MSKPEKMYQGNCDNSLQMDKTNESMSRKATERERKEIIDELGSSLRTATDKRRKVARRAVNPKREYTDN